MPSQFETWGNEPGTGALTKQCEHGIEQIGDDALLQTFQ